MANKTIDQLAAITASELTSNDLLIVRLQISSPPTSPKET